MNDRIILVPDIKKTHKMARDWEDWLLGIGKG